MLDDEILTALAELNYRCPTRRWRGCGRCSPAATRVSRYLRARKSTLPMPEAKVRAFELRLGTDRSGDRLLQAQARRCRRVADSINAISAKAVA